MKKLIPLLIGVIAGSIIVPLLVEAIVRVLEPDYIRPKKCTLGYSMDV